MESERRGGKYSRDGDDSDNDNGGDNDNDDDNDDDDYDNDDDVQELRESRSAAGSPSSLMKIMEDYKATEFISIFQKFKLAFNLLV